MPEMMAAFLVRYYGMSEEDATEILSELTDRKSLERLAGYRVATKVSPME